MMMGMAGKRLAAAGILAAAVAATAALWVAQHTPLASQLRAIRPAQAAVTAASIAHVRVPPVQLGSQFAALPPVGLPVTGGVVLTLVLVGTALRQGPTAVPVPARPPRRGRAPPSPDAFRHPARTRSH
jgi:hypothetical protein